MSNVAFYRGNSLKYNQNTMQNGIYFATDENTIKVNGTEYGNYPMDFEIPSEGTTIEYKTFCRNYSPNSSRFEYTTDIDFANGDFIEAEIDFSTSTNDNGITALSIGSDITGWRNNILWVFFNHQKPWSGGCNVLIEYTNPNGDYPMAYKIADTSSIFKIKLSSQGVFVNGTQLTAFNSSMMSPLTTLSTIHFGSNRDETQSDASYRKIALYKVIDEKSMGIMYKENANDTKFIEFECATQTKNGIMSYQDKQKLDNASYALEWEDL